MSEPIKTARGVYLDLTKSPYEYKTPWGDTFKFSSAKKLEIYTRDIPKEVARLEKLMERHNLGGFVPDEIVQLMTRAVYRAFYRKIEV